MGRMYGRRGRPPRVKRRRKARAAFQAVLIFTGLFLFGFLSDRAASGDTWGLVVSGVLAAGLAVAAVGSRTIRPAAASPAPPSQVAAPVQTPQVSTPAPRATGEPLSITVQGPGELPTFADVGGMLPLKTELKDTVGLMLASAGEVRTARLRWNGLLLHGPPGVGKSFIARATAGELGLDLIRVTTADVVSPHAGEDAGNLRRAFTFAAAHIPCILFFDELDSIARRGDDSDNQEARATVDELLREVEQWRRVPELVVMAATDELDALDPAVVRPGRFDRHIPVDLPDAPARAAILGALLRGRNPASDVDLHRLAVSARGLTPAAIARAVEAASRAASEESTGSGQVVQLGWAHLRTALEQRGDTDRPMVEDWSWDRLILPAATKTALQRVVAMVKDPELARSLGVEPPTGLLLTGPPGTGKTTIARVIAAQAGCSFYPITAADVTGPWPGEPEGPIPRSFGGAGENERSLVFVDQIDANRLLTGIDGAARQPGVFVVVATDRPDQLDPTVLRDARLSCSIEVPLPDFKARIALLQLFTAGIPLDRVDVDHLARRTAGLSGADLEALCQQAAIEAVARAAAVVTAEDMDAALARRGAGRSPGHPGGGSDQQRGGQPPKGADGVRLGGVVDG